MSVCPLCNGLTTLSLSCPNCQTYLDDQGKISDYFDDYSSYLDIDMTNMIDGAQESLEEAQCLHYFYCPDCHYEEIKSVNETDLE